MRRFSGAGGILYALGERLSFSDVPLVSEDGWDWIAPEDLSYWLPEGLQFRASVNGEWIWFAPVEIFHGTGRVGFPRNLSGCSVYVSGECLPCSRICESRTWEMTVDSVVSENPSFGGGHSVRILGTSAVLHGVEVPIEQVLCRLPTSGGGMFVGVGEARQVGPDVHIKFEEGVSYGFR